jgi:hypothetical protein
MYTLVDITKTGARKGDDLFKIKQQQNYLTAENTISIRSNPIIKNINKQFDDNKQTDVWIIDFDFENQNAHSIEMLTNDFDLVPVIPINNFNAFLTKTGKINTWFEINNITE